MRGFPPVQQTLKLQTLPAPMGGINAVDSLVALPPSDSVFQYNLIPAQYGCRVRTGYRPWATGLDSPARSILPYTASVASANKLFAATMLGIYDVTTDGTASPAASVTFGVQNTLSGYSGWLNFTITGGTHNLLYCDEANGYYVYAETGGTWTKVTAGAGATQISGVDPALFVWPVLWQSRVWFVEKDSSRAWYTNLAGAIYGPVTSFDFGNKFKNGGSLVALYTWTFDGGNGINDYLVAISSGGDVIIYQGTDPTVSTGISQVGQWYIGPPPAGRRIAGSFGGDLYILSSYGLIPLTKLVSGILVQDEVEYVTSKITPIINSEMALSRTSLGWEVRLISNQSLLLISTPKRDAASYTQYVQYLNSKGWATYRDIPYNTGIEWTGQFFIADGVTGRIHLHTGNLDNGTTQISFTMLSSFQDFQEMGMNHNVQLIRPVFLAAAAPSVICQVRYDYTLTEVFGAPVGGTTTGAKWDAGIWDSALWSLDSIVVQPVQGASGIGRAIAIGINGQSGAETVLIRIDVMFNTGNFL